MATIITDLSGVLVQGGIEGAKIAERRLGIPARKLLWVYLLLHETYDRLLRGEISERTFWERFIDKGHFNCTVEDLGNCLRESISKVVPGTLGVYESIVACPEIIGNTRVISYNKPRFILASDHDQEQIPFLKSAHPEIFRFFTDVYWSCELGVRKKDGPQFLARVMKDHGLSHSNAIFIDDNPKNLRVASSLGLTSIRFRSAKKLKAELKNLGFEFYAS